MHAPTRSILIAALLVTAAAAARADSPRDRLLAIPLEVEGCGKQKPAYLELAEQLHGEGAGAWAATALASAALCAADLGQTDEALGMLGRAVELGFDDCWGLLELDSAKKLHGHPAMQKILAAVTMSPADYAELSWIVREYSALFHDTNMMITENMNRPDDDWTAVPRSDIPGRATRSPAVLIARELLVGLQGWQANMVMRSDQMRKSHNLNMYIIDNMPAGSRGIDPVVVERSRQEARRRAEQRAREVAERAFRARPLSTEPVACVKLLGR